MRPRSLDISRLLSTEAHAMTTPFRALAKEPSASCTPITEPSAFFRMCATSQPISISMFDRLSARFFSVAIWPSVAP